METQTMDQMQKPRQMGGSRCCSAAEEVIQLREHIDLMCKERRQLYAQIEELKVKLEICAKKNALAA